MPENNSVSTFVNRKLEFKVSTPVLIQHAVIGSQITAINRIQGNARPWFQLRESRTAFDPGTRTQVETRKLEAHIRRDGDAFALMPNLSPTRGIRGTIHSRITPLNIA